jgi:putative peptidoglycan lipid II flippase
LYFGARFSKLTTPTLTNIRITPRIKSFLSKLIPVLAGAGVAQVNVFMGSLFGSFLPTGCISYIYFADRFIQLPLALFGISMGIVLVPEIAKSIAKKENENLQEVQNKAIVFTMRLTIPSVVGLISLSYLLISSLYGHGRFSETSVQKTADVLKVFAIGLPGYVAAKIISSVLFAQKDSRTPVNATIMSIIVNVILSAILLMPFQEIGIAIATSVSGFVNVYALCRKSKGWFVGNREIFFDLLKIIWSSAIMLIVIIFIQKLIPISYSNITHEILLTCFCSIIGFIAYISSLFFLKDAATRDFIAKLISYTQPEST